ncbi:MAG: envelope stress response membrane protein PspC [Deltaproteobacteria bacterium]|jgi:phage shock protein C|nr:envelope stress response membrane protein PspC [Deltaproteobacteria bacterium]
MKAWKSRYGRPMYRSRKGVVLGVCRGVADYFNFRVFWVRMIVVAMLLVSGIWPVIFIYIIASLVMKPEPVRPIETEAEAEFYDSYVNSRANAAARLKRRFRNLERRIRRMEDTVTSREFDWKRKFQA